MPTTGDPAHTRRSGLLRTGLYTALVWIAPPAAASALLVLGGLPSAAATGLCPAAPPDVPAYPCTTAEYILRMTFGPWALMGHLTLGLGWALVATVGCAVVRLLRVMKRAGPGISKPAF